MLTSSPRQQSWALFDIEKGEVHQSYVSYLRSQTEKEQGCDLKANHLFYSSMLFPKTVREMYIPCFTPFFSLVPWEFRELSLKNKQIIILENNFLKLFLNIV